MPEEISPLDNFWNTFSVLANDVSRCMKVLQDPQVTDSVEIMFWDRALARSFFALLEGTAYGMTWLAYDYVQTHEDHHLSSAEVEALRYGYDFDDSIEPEVKYSPAPLLAKIQWAFDVFARVHRVDDFKMCDSDEWMLMVKMFAIREMYEYARTPDDLIIYEPAREALIEGATWFMTRVIQLIERCHHGMEAYRLTSNSEGDVWESDANDFVM
ncbi:MAG TPA: hypothetical protein VN937_13935 [Blastocatellia bacterium]|nr:hypothetical protein [Blastocatellia bacterium]